MEPNYHGAYSEHNGDVSERHSMWSRRPKQPEQKSQTAENLSRDAHPRAPAPVNLRRGHPSLCAIHSTRVSTRRFARFTRRRSAPVALRDSLDTTQTHAQFPIHSTRVSRRRGTGSVEAHKGCGNGSVGRTRTTKPTTVGNQLLREGGRSVAAALLRAEDRDQSVCGVL